MSNYLSPDAKEEGYEDGTESGDDIDESLLEERPLPRTGPYPNVVCTDATLARSKKGNAMVVVTLSSADPEASAKYYIVNASGTTRYSEGLAIFGVTKETLLEAFRKGKSAAVAKLFVGKKCAAEGTHETYLGSRQFKFDSLAPPVEGAGFREFGEDE